MLIVQVHSLAGITRQDVTAENVAEVVRATVAPESWIEVGGQGVAVPFKKETIFVLVIRQTTTIHAEIDTLLDALR